MLALLLSMIVLGLSAIDPIGIGLILLLLTRKNPYLRSSLFLAGSFCALLLIGFLFAQGLGVLILRTEDHHHWMAPSFQIIAGVMLIIFAVYSTNQKKSGETVSTRGFNKYLEVNNLLLFIFGFTLVIAQSIIDVVFVVAMTHVARLHLSSPRLFIAILIYTLAALSLQIAIVVAYAGTPPKRRQQIIKKSNLLLEQYGQKVTIGIGLILGLALCINGLLMATGKHHF